MRKSYLILILAILLGGVLYFAWPKKAPSPVNSSWKTVNDAKQGISYQYPEQLSTQYIKTQDWPPKVIVSQGSPYPCPTGSRQIDGKFSYCVQTQTEGAAGSVYTTYTYATGSFGGNKTVTINFTLRLVQCGNYVDPQKTDCEQERQTFDIDGLADQIVHTIVFQK